MTRTLTWTAPPLARSLSQGVSLLNHRLQLDALKSTLHLGGADADVARGMGAMVTDDDDDDDGAGAEGEEEEEEDEEEGGGTDADADADAMVSLGAPPTVVDPLIDPLTDPLTDPLMQQIQEALSQPAALPLPAVRSPETNLLEEAAALKVRALYVLTHPYTAQLTPAHTPLTSPMIPQGPSPIYPPHSPPMSSLTHTPHP